MLVIRVLEIVDPVQPRAGLEFKTSPPKITQGTLLPYVHPVRMTTTPWFLPAPKKAKGSEDSSLEQSLLKAFLSLPEVS